MAPISRMPMDDIVCSLEPATYVGTVNSAVTLFKEYMAKNCLLVNHYLPAMAEKELSTANAFLSLYSGFLSKKHQNTNELLYAQYFVIHRSQPSERLATGGKSGPEFTRDHG